MMLRVHVSLAALLLATGATAGGDLKSGPQPGQGISGKFLPQWVNGDHGGGKACPV